MDGYAQLVMKMKEGTFEVRGFKLVILLVGRGQVWDTDRHFFESVNSAIEVVQTQNDKCIIMLGASLPSSKDTQAMISTFTFRNDKLAGRCASNSRLEHARPGKHLLGLWGAMEEYFDDYGNVNEFGCDVIARALERKIFSTKLLERFHKLSE